MGVMQCERGDCTHILCDFIVNNQYLCWSCHEELERWQKTWNKDTKVSDVRERIRSFMASNPGDYMNKSDSSDQDDVEAEWERLKPRKLRGD